MHAVTRCACAQGWLACVVSERTTDKVGRSGILLPIEGDCWQVVMSAREGAARVALPHRLRAPDARSQGPGCISCHVAHALSASTPSVLLVKLLTCHRPWTGCRQCEVGLFGTC